MIICSIFNGITRNSSILFSETLYLTFAVYGLLEAGERKNRIFSVVVLPVIHGVVYRLFLTELFARAYQKVLAVEKEDSRLLAVCSSAAVALVLGIVAKRIFKEHLIALALKQARFAHPFVKEALEEMPGDFLQMGLVYLSCGLLTEKTKLVAVGAFAQGLRAGTAEDIKSPFSRKVLLLFDILVLAFSAKIYRR